MLTEEQIQTFKDAGFIFPTKDGKPANVIYIPEIYGVGIGIPDGIPFRTVKDGHQNFWEAAGGATVEEYTRAWVKTVQHNLQVMVDTLYGPEPSKAKRKGGSRTKMIATVNNGCIRFNQCVCKLLRSDVFEFVTLSKSENGVQFTFSSTVTRGGIQVAKELGKNDRFSVAIRAKNELEPLFGDAVNSMQTLEYDIDQIDDHTLMVFL